MTEFFLSAIQKEESSSFLCVLAVFKRKDDPNHVRASKLLEKS